MDKAKISATILLLITIAIVLSFNFDVTTVHDADQSLLYVNESKALSPTEQGITSSSLYALNNSYLSFDGVDDYVHGNAFEMIRDKNQSISLWINIKSCGEHIVTNRYNLTEQFAMGCRDTNGKIEGSMMNSTGGANYWGRFASDSALNLNEWYYLTLVYNGTLGLNTDNTSFYINGIKQSGSSNFGSASSSNGFWIGAQGNPSSFFNGLIDEVRIYNRSLEESEITEIYNSGRYKNLSLPSDGLVLYMPFEETNGTTIYDNSGNNNNGELIYE